MKRKDTVDFKLYLITDRKLVSRHVSLVTAVKDALKGGVKAIQLREKDLNTRDLLKLAYDMRKITNRYNAKLFINERLDIALAVGADGVHLTQNSIPADAVKRTVRKKLLIGVSTHSLKEARDAERAGADFITFGPVYMTPSKLKYGRPLGTGKLKNICSRVHIPVHAIGGIKSHKIKETEKAGAFGVALISEIFAAEDIKGKAKELIGILEDMNKY